MGSLPGAAFDLKGLLKPLDFWKVLVEDLKPLVGEQTSRVDPRVRVLLLVGRRVDGLELVEKLIAECDAIVENYTPRVLENFGLSWERVKELNPRALMMRMPAFGLSGPWRDNTGFAQTMEQLSGLAWMTGH